MTNNQLTREENVQAVFDLKAGYTLGLADVEILKRVARMALAAMDSEPVFILEVARADYKGQKLGNHFGFITLDAARELKEGNYQLYAAQPAPVVMDDIKLRELFDSWFASDCSFDRSPEASEEDNIAWRESYWYVWQRCRAAMLQAGNSPVIPDGYVMVPIDATRAMIDAARRVEEDGYDAMHKAMLAAAPQPQNAPQNIPEIIPGWIPVSERMPENDVSVLTFDGMYRRVHHAMYGHWQCWEPEKITHWMPLPNPPKGVK